MIPFFRKIRKTLADDNKPIKYMRYAVGEIVLVVIGILIALQINNWNESRKDRIYEIKMLSEISTSLKTDVFHFKEMIKTFDELYETSDYFMELSKKNIKYYDSLLGKVFELNRSINYQYNSGPYEALKSSGIDKISNDKLRNDITYLYDFELPILGNNIAHITRNHQKNIESMLEMFGERYVDDSRGYNSIGWNNVPKDLFQSQGFLQLIAGVSFRGLSAGRQLKLALPKIEKTIEDIDNEIKK
ncbi:DUF6090 family protein [Gaetbulibacter aquiaggeris]|uniref:DUF6090 family protein n=1 Tax=Gaetbulibacter aquiaggeris TaxID=1735373 RepID=A0ABW7MNK1_9FLAO